MWAQWPGLGDLWQLAGLRFDVPTTHFSAHIFRKLFKAFKEDLMHHQKGFSNAIICLLIHTLLFSLSPLPTEVGEAGRRRELHGAGWKEPCGWGAVGLPLARRGEHQRGVDGFRKDLSASCWLQHEGCGRAAEGSGRLRSGESGTGSGWVRGAACQTQVASTMWPASGKQTSAEKVFISWIKTPQCYILISYPFYLDGYKNADY